MKPYWTSKDGRHVLYNADCLDVLPTLSGVDAVVTDPPYGIADKAFDSGIRSGKRTGGDNVWHAESWWDAELNELWMVECSKVAPVIAWFGHWRKREQVAASISMPLRAEIVWAKDCHVGPPCPVAMRDERIWIFGKNGIKGQTFETSVWDEAIIPTWSHKDHKNEKPVPLMERLLMFLGPNVVLDPFTGSGTTGVACIRTGRRFIGIEISREYCDIAVKRMERELSQPKLPGMEPERITQLSLLEAV